MSAFDPKRTLTTAILVVPLRHPHWLDGGFHLKIAIERCVPTLETKCEIFSWQFCWLAPSLTSARLMPQADVVLVSIADQTADVRLMRVWLRLRLSRNHVE
jgi:hypothetical protein